MKKYKIVLYPVIFLVVVLALLGSCNSQIFGTVPSTQTPTLQTTPMPTVFSFSHSSTTEVPLPSYETPTPPEPTIIIIEPTKETKTRTVYITRTGSKYHRAGCRYLRQSCIPVKLSVAISQGYEPCSVCDP